MREPQIRQELARLGATLVLTPTFVGGVGGVDIDTRCITARLDLTDAELRCTVMHELGHLELGHTGCGSETEELQATAWAAMRLVPETIWQFALTQARDERELCEILGIDEDTMQARSMVCSESELLLRDQHRRLALAVRAEGEKFARSAHLRAM